MSKLSLEARALLQEAKAQEEPASLATLQRVRRGVRATVVGMALAHGAAASTVGGASLAAKVVSFALVGFGLGATGFGVATLVEKHESTSPLPPPAALSQKAGHAVRVPRRDEPSVGASALPPPTTASASRLSPESSAPPPTNASASRLSPESSALASTPGSSLENSRLTAQAEADRSTARAEAEPTLQQELRLLAQVQAELRQGNGERALALLDRNRGPLGGSQQLAEERLAAEVFAACGAGNAARGKRAAEQFLRRAPSSPLAPRVRASCGGKAR